MELFPAEQIIADLYGRAHAAGDNGGMTGRCVPLDHPPDGCLSLCALGILLKRLYILGEGESAVHVAHEAAQVYPVHRPCQVPYLLFLEHIDLPFRLKGISRLTFCQGRDVVAEIGGKHEIGIEYEEVRFHVEKTEGNLAVTERIERERHDTIIAPAGCRKQPDLWYSAHMDVLQEYERLLSVLQGLGRVVVCYSGGVDSTLLLRAALDALGKERVLALIARSETYPEREIEEAVAFAASCEAPYEVIETDEMGDDCFLRNTTERCYYCKQHLFGRAREIARARGFDHVVEGSNVDDQGDYRPGRRAGKELAIRSPLLEAGLTKRQIRQISEALGLPTHDKPSLACLASRIPYGTRVEADILHKIERSEEFLRSLGIGQVRVRYHGQVARIEVLEEDFDKVMTLKDDIADALNKAGFLYVTLDLKGYRTGSMNEGLDPPA